MLDSGNGGYLKRDKRTSIQKWELHDDNSLKIWLKPDSFIRDKKGRNRYLIWRRVALTAG